MIVRGGKRCVSFAGLLDEAYSRGLKSIGTELLQAPSEENANAAVVKATVQTLLVDPKTGEASVHPETQEPLVGTFSGICDVSLENVSRNIALHILR